MNLYFEHSNGKYSLVAKGITREDVMPYIYEDVHRRNPNYTVYYVRETVMPNSIWFDIGSHTESYHLTNEVWEVKDETIVLSGA